MGAGKSEETRAILEMLAEGRITAEEAEKLIAAVSQGVENGGSNATKPRYLRVLVEPGAGRENGERVNIRVPLALVRAGLRFASLVPKTAREKVSEALKGKGVDVDLERIRFEELAEQLNDLSIDVEGGEKIRVYCE